ncbi:diguanylate cyclase (GGDEF) domain-containing protein [Actinopolyspora xinjiangensis]|uniref:Diguanylate cyclase (GGDEF) domain-containing protein n=1 Tax=Actinopolyspora xinjiangensis TaxID=405564 RepID=A0A1H0RSC7_9ACTN|nr:GGDEF domain-containing protein [Actinopolyspora xinjiangensis]SDP32461.1 diguanylate cyclase (GGDEF) domain-containing protein [Actinopolyspora xinjiangensis]
MTRHFPLLSALVCCYVVAVLAVLGSGVLTAKAALIVDDVAQLISGSAATIACWWQARFTRGSQRLWRSLLGLGTAGWTAGMAVWAWFRTFADIPLPSPSLADVGFLTLPVFALPALLVFAEDSTPVKGITARSSRGTARTRAVLVLDGLIVTGSLFLLTWATALGAVVSSGAPTVPGFVVAVAYPVTDLVLVVIVILLASFRRAGGSLRLLLLGSGLIALSVSDSIFAYLVSSGAPSMNPLFDAGFVAGPALIALAALAPDHRDTGEERPRRDRAVDWAHLMLPYLPLMLAAGFTTVKTVLGSGSDDLEVVGVFLLFVLVVIRQLVTLIDNAKLLEKVRSAQQDLAHQASHDPLTGLANRTLLYERLSESIRRNRETHYPFGLLYLDLDGFKMVNDTFGHAAGDALLRDVADRLRECVRAADTVARLGGDEFAVLVETERRQDSEQVGGRVLAALQRPFDVEGRSHTIGGSLGVVHCPADGEISAQTLLHHADVAMYTTKQRRKRRARVPGPHESSAQEATPAPVEQLTTPEDTSNHGDTRLRDDGVSLHN